jgi:hypothetical protein
VTGASHATGGGQPSRLSWQRAWPGYLLALFAALALAPAVPAGLARAAVTVPILLSVPGALLLGALLAFGGQARRSFDAVGFGCLAAVLSAVMLAFAALVLNAAQVRITAVSVYACLLVPCAMLAAVVRLRLGRPGPGGDEAAVMGILALPAQDAGRRRGSAVRYAVAALAACGVLLGGAAYGYAKGPRPSPVGYTWLAWTGPRIDGVISVGRSGRTLPFVIRHEQSAAAEFRLTADWTGDGRQHQLAVPVTVRVGADKTVSGRLAIPQPPGGCAYRLVVSLTEIGAAHAQTWTINADVRRSSPGSAGCAA